jgi:hypothetical protein
MTDEFTLDAILIIIFISFKNVTYNVYDKVKLKKNVTVKLTIKL